ncbi:hypothetical protein VNO77_05065 [Canavalia gladiata]|uniref:NB-ARC domain-containing protein n=1 Tax=Canavalia gladiata TaxID=3824 RepID=A0AAN9MXP8_CANGL
MYSNRELDAIQNKVSQETQSTCLRGDILLTKNVIIAQKLPPKLVDEMLLGETIGLDLMFNKFWSFLEDENVGIIGLYGMGGAGKTTLMKRIHNECGKRKHEFMDSGNNDLTVMEGGPELMGGIVGE